MIDQKPPNKEDSRKCFWKFRCFKHCRLLDEDATPPNYKVIFLIFLSLFSSAFTLTFLFPFLPEMVRTFGFSEQEKGYYVGIIASSVFAGRALGSYFWGWLSDKKGRKIVLLLTVLGNGVFSLIFGFTSNLPMAIITRFLTGVANGTVGTAKTILYEISDDTNQALAMSILSLSWGVGLFLGPAFGGFLASPAKKYPKYFDPEGFFGKFPYVLPGAVSFIVAFTVFLIVLFKMPETNGTMLNSSLTIPNENESDQKNSEKKEKKSKGSSKILGRTSSQLLDIEGHHVEAVTGAFLARIQEESSLDRQFLSKSCISLPEEFIYGSRDFDTQSAKLSPSRSSHSIIPSRNVSHTNLPILKNESFALLPSDVQSKLEKGSFTVEIKDISKPNNMLVPALQQEPKVTDKLMSVTPSEDPPKHTNSLCYKLKKSTLVTLLSMGDVRKSVALYTMFSFGVIGFEDTFTIWASTESRLDGLGFNTDQLGIATGIVAVPIMFLQVFIFAPMARRYGILKTFLANVTVLIITVTLCPVTHLYYNKPIRLWVTLMLLLIPQRICTSCCFSATSLLINNSVTPNIAGSVNGIAMTSTALARAFAPTFGGSLFAWSISSQAEKIGPPFDVNLAFFLFGFVFWICAILGVATPRSLNKQKKRPTATTQTAS